MCQICGYGARPESICLMDSTVPASEYDGPPDPVDSDGRL